MRRLARSVAARLGYEVHRMTDEDTAARSARDHESYTRWSAPCPVFTPWIGQPEFEALYEGVGPLTKVSRDRCYFLAKLAEHASYLRGELAECGVYRGGSALLLCHVIVGTGKRLYLFDSFEGLPTPQPDKDGGWFEEGQFAIDTVDSVKHLLRDFEEFTEVRKGWFPETFGGLEDASYAFAHIDVDLYRSALDCCEHFYPRLVPGGVLLFDEYGFATAPGEREAVDEFFADKRESPIVLPTGQAMVLKLPEPAP